MIYHLVLLQGSTKVLVHRSTKVLIHGNPIVLIHGGPKVRNRRSSKVGVRRGPIVGVHGGTHVWGHLTRGELSRPPEGHLLGRDHPKQWVGDGRLGREIRLCLEK